MTDDETPMEKLLQASGVPKKSEDPGQVTTEELKRLFATLMSELESGRAEVKRSQDQNAKMIRDLERYCEQTLPRKILEAVEGAATQGVCKCLEPLHVTVMGANDDIQRCRAGLGRITWYWFRDVALAGLVMGLVGGLMVRYAFVLEVEEAKRYEVWGRRVEQRVLKMPLDRRDYFYRWAGGRP